MKKYIVLCLESAAAAAPGALSFAQSAPPPPQIVVRATSALPDSAISYIADISVPVRKVIPAGVQPEDFIRDFCGGSLTDTYLKKVIENNPDLVLRQENRERNVQLPACVRWQRNAKVTVPEGSSLDALIEKAVGKPSDSMLAVCDSEKTEARCGSTLRRLTAKLNTVRNLDNLAPGTQITLPIVTDWTTVTLKNSLGSDPETTSRNAVEALNQLVKVSSYASTAAASPLIHNEPAAQIQLIKPVAADDPASSKPACRNAAQKADMPWPIDAAAVARALDRSVREVARRTSAAAPRTTVRILDTGFIGVPGKRFRRDLLAPSLQEPRERRYGISAESPSSLAPYDGYFPLHGTEVAEMALGGSQFRKSYPKLGKLLGLHFSKAVRAHVQQPATSTHGPIVQYQIEEAFVYQSLNYRSPTPTVINVSIGSAHALAPIPQLLASAPDTLLVVAAGNDHNDLTSTGWYPANYGGEGERRDQVITVGAHDENGELAEFSNYGRSKVDLLAPGCRLVFESDSGKEELLFGTSFAAPLVSFTAALLSSLRLPPPLEIKTRLWASVDYRPSLDSAVLTSGTLNVVKALYVFDDTVELSNDHAILPGRWQHDMAVKLCPNEEFAAESLLKITPVHGRGGPPQLRILYRDTDRRVASPKTCTPADQGITFWVIGEAQARSISWTQLADLVPRYFRLP